LAWILRVRGLAHRHPQPLTQEDAHTAMRPLNENGTGTGTCIFPRGINPLPRYFSHYLPSSSAGSEGHLGPPIPQQTPCCPCPHVCGGPWHARPSASDPGRRGRYTAWQRWAHAAPHSRPGPKLHRSCGCCSSKAEGQTRPTGGGGGRWQGVARHMHHPGQPAFPGRRPGSALLLLQLLPARRSGSAVVPGPGPAPPAPLLRSTGVLIAGGIASFAYRGT
jgi:hypothetical protein